MDKQNAARKNCYPAFNAEQCVVYLDDIPTLSSKSRQNKNLVSQQRHTSGINRGDIAGAVASMTESELGVLSEELQTAPLC